MLDSTLATLLTGAGVAGVFCVLFVLGLIFPKSVVSDLQKQLEAKDQALAAERDRGDAAVAAAQASRDMMTALQAGIQIARQPAQEAAPRGGAGK